MKLLHLLLISLFLCLATQFSQANIHYAPYGELLASQHAYGSSYDERYKFTGKERDAESGYDFFGARFLSNQLGIWISVDPLVDKYIYSNPYMYCNGNPVKNVDPNGKWVETAWDIVNVMIDVASLASNIENGNTKDAIIDGVGLVMDVAAVLLPVPGGAGSALKSVRAADKANDAVRAAKASGGNVSKVAKQGQNAKGIGNYIAPNNGKSKPHGGKIHNKAIDNTIDHLPKGAQHIRKNQTQVDANGNKIGNNRPDIQYDLNGTHYNVEIDNNPARSAEHGRVLKQNDPNSQVILILIE